MSARGSFRLARPREGLVSLGSAAAAIALVAVVLVALLAAGGFDVASALGALWASAFGSSDAIASATLVRTTPLLLTGLAVSIAFAAGVFNIGAEGQLLAGAAAATALALTLDGTTWGGTAWVAVPLTLTAGVVAGALWAFVPAVLRVRFQVLEVISTIMMNFVAAFLVGWLVRGPLQEPTRIYPQSRDIASATRLPIIVAGTRLHLGFVLALLLALGTWILMRRTAEGFRMRAVGANPSAAHSAGLIRVDNVVLRTLLLSGAIAGLAGAIEVTGVTYALYENISPGYGYTAIAVALLARLDPLWCVATALLFGALDAGSTGMQRDAGVPASLTAVIQATVILGLLAATWLRQRTPKAAEAGT